MSSLTRKPNCQFWIGCFTDATGKQRQRSTRLTDRRAALKLVETWESVYRRRLSANQTRRVIADAVRELTGEDVAGETVTAYLKRWAERKAVETSIATASAYRSVAASFTTYLGERSNRMLLDEVTVAHIAAWRDAAGYGFATHPSLVTNDVPSWWDGGAISKWLSLE